MTAPGCVVDAGVVVGWFIDAADGGPAGADEARALLEAATAGRLRLWAPELLLAEVGNVLWKLARFRGLPAVGATRAVSAMQDAPITLTPLAPDIGRALALALAYGCTVYDAAYLALAERLSVPLLTTDERLVRRVELDLPWVRAL